MGKENKKQIISKSDMIAIKNATGDIVDTAKITMIIQRDTPKYKGEPFTMLFQAVNKAIARNITPVTAKLLLYLISDVGYGNAVGKGISQISKDLCYSERQVYRAMKELEDLKVVVKSKNETDGRLAMYFINPTQSWKGTIKDRAAKISEFNPKQLDIFGEIPSETKKLIPNEDF